MLPNKKKAQSEDNEHENIIDFDYVLFMAMNRLGFKYEEARHMYFGQYVNLMEIYKTVYNFETKRCLYDTGPEEKKVSSLMDL